MLPNGAVMLLAFLVYLAMLFYFPLFHTLKGKPVGYSGFAAITGPVVLPWGKDGLNPVAVVNF